MKTKVLLISFVLVILFPFLSIQAQDSSSVKKHVRPKTIWEIPHKTAYEKWMWIHRSVALTVTKERKINYDTAYIKSNYKRFVVTLPIANKFLKFSFVDLENGNRLVFAPNLQYNLGLCISSRWASFIINSRIKVYGDDANVKGETKYNDIQFSLFTRKITTDMFVQNYKGFYIKNSKDYTDYVSDKPYQIRADVSAFNMGVSTYYIVNSKKFSYGNSFAFVEQQKKSAGSVLIGVYYSFFEAKSSESLVSEPFRSSFDSLSFVRSGHVHNFGINLGYIYTLVFLKKCYTTVSLVQGFGGKRVVYTHEDNSVHQQLLGAAGKIHLRFGLGYDQGRYFVGVMGSFEYFLFGNKANSTFDYSHGKSMIYVGYRFSVLKNEKKLLRKLKLIDYW